MGGVQCYDVSLWMTCRVDGVRVWVVFNVGGVQSEWCSVREAFCVMRVQCV